MIISKKINIIKPKKISMDTLGKMIKGGFEESHSELVRFKDKVETSFKEVNKRFDDVDRRFDEVDKKFAEQKSYMDIGFQKLGEQIDAVESNLEIKINKKGTLVHY